MKTNSKLINKTVIYTLGNLGSKLLSYIMVLFYTHYIAAGELGYVDVVFSTVSMILPIVMCQISDGIYRYSIDSNDDTYKKNISSGFFFILAIALIYETIFCIISKCIDLQYGISIAAYVITFEFYQYFHDSTRAINNSKLYAASDVVWSLVMLACELIGILYLHLGGVVLLIANSFASIFCICFLLIAEPRIRTSLNFKFFDITTLKKLLRYSLPLIPTNIAWWVINSSDRYVIAWKLGNVQNGIYSVSNKFPTALNMITWMFYLAWQDTSITEFTSKEKNKKFNFVFDRYYTFLFSASILAIPIIKVIVILFVGAEYAEAWKYSDILFLGASFAALCSFMSTGYQAAKETSKTVKSTLIAAAINLAIDIALIEYIGLYAASISTLVAYFVLFIFRLSDCKKYYEIKMNKTKFLALLILWLAFAIISIFDTKLSVIDLIETIASLLLFFLINKNLLISILGKK